MDSQPTVWINVTTSSQWHRAVVGVVRVEKELSLGLQKLYPEGCYKRCVWQVDRFVEYVPAPGEVVQEASGVDDPSEVQSAPAQRPLLFPILSRREAANAIAQGILSLAPSRLRPVINRVLCCFKNPLARLVCSQPYRRLKQYFQRPSRVGTEVAEVFGKATKSIFSPGDVLLSVGLDWDYPYAKEFMRLRKTESVKIVRCCYDLIPVLYPQYCVADVAAHFTRYFLDVADSSDRVLCISRQSESDLEDLLSRTGGRPVATRVFTLGDNVIEGRVESIGSEVRDIVAAPFILYVSTIERRKNHQVLYQAYHQLCKEGKKDLLPKLVFVGMRGWGVDELLKDIELDPVIKDTIVLCNHVNDAELQLLYQQSVCCVFPSLYEGWGLPVAEALALGKIVLSSDRGSLKEVGGDLATYIDPWHSGAWAEEIERIVCDHDYRERLAEQVRATYRPRQWRDTAVSVKAVLDELLVPLSEPQTFYCGYDLTVGVGQPVGPLIKSRGRHGLLFSGPNKVLAAGRYVLEIWDRPTQRTRGCCSVCVYGDGVAIAAQNEIDFTPTNDQQVLLRLSFELSAQVDDFDVQCRLTAGEISVERLVLMSQ
jgi:glycosyltransferase involved in cell wall biosynthesis